MKCHSKRITAIYYDSSSKTVYTISKDGTLAYLKMGADLQISSEINIWTNFALAFGSLLAGEAIGASLLCMKADMLHQRLFVGTGNGNFCVIDTSTVIIELKEGTHRYY